MNYRISFRWRCWWKLPCGDIKRSGNCVVYLSHLDTYCDLKLQLRKISFLNSDEQVRKFTSMIKLIRYDQGSHVWWVKCLLTNAGWGFFVVIEPAIARVRAICPFTHGWDWAICFWLCLQLQVFIWVLGLMNLSLFFMVVLVYGFQTVFDCWKKSPLLSVDKCIKG